MQQILNYLIVAAVIVVFSERPCSAWFECGHHIIAVMAFDLLPADEQQALLTILAAHPRYAEDFAPPESVQDVDRWRIGTAGYWPDIARSQPEFNRPTWHYQLGATLPLGDAGEVNVPDEPGPLPEHATLETQDLHIAQAVTLCRQVLGSSNSPQSDRAIAMTWLAHLVGDAHQPCHAGSLYAPNVLRDGDRGANSIPVGDRSNLHAIWDGLLGDRYETGDIRRRIHEIRETDGLIEQGRAAAAMEDGLSPLTWLNESRELAIRHVYTADILDAVTAASRSGAPAVERITLSESYLRQAGKLARIRASDAAFRLAAIWRQELQRSGTGR